ncbi:MAG: methyltransferase domain-containing protein [Pseudomonadota bacterium]
MTKKFQTWEQAVQWLRQQPDQQELVLAAYYDDPLIEAAERYRSSEEWAEIRQFLPVNRFRALDVGAGRGIASYALACEGFSEVVALEPDKSEIVGAAAIRSLAQKTTLPICVIEKFSERLPYESNSFDVVFARAVLHHIKDLDAACSEFYRVLRPGGKLIAVREHVISRQEDLPQFLDEHPLHKFYGGENAFLLKQYERSILEAGFHSLIRVAPLNSAINFSPYSLKSLQRKVAEGVARNNLVTALFVEKALALFWPILRPLLNAIDNRPGRLYSFIAEKG